MLKKFYLILFSISLASASVIAQSKSSSEENELRDKIARFAPTVITADLKNLSPNDRKALGKIIAAARLSPGGPQRNATKLESYTPRLISAFR